MFVPRMWFDEVERIGKQRCTPIGYALQGIGDIIGFAGLLTLIGLPLYLAFTAVAGSFIWPLLWLLVIPVVLGFIGSVLVSFSWWLAHRKQFQYDYERRVSRWVNGGQEQSFTYADWQAEQIPRSR